MVQGGEPRPRCVAPGKLNHSPGTKIPDLMLLAVLIGEPFRAKQLLGLIPMFQGAAFRTTLPLPDLTGQRLNFLLLPGFHS
jgi:hypothetical protein